MTTPLLCLASVLASVAGAPAGTPDGTPPNVLLILADDVGVDALAAYQEGADYPATPAIDLLAQGGVLFRNVWSNPNCSPTRASIVTGRYAMRTGIGTIVSPLTPGLPLSETTLPELLDLGASGYAHALIGKWHLGQDAQSGGSLAPNLAGFSHFDGSLGNVGASYYAWSRTTDGATVLEERYNTTVLVDAALEWIGAQTTPWFCLLSFQAPHEPWHAPPPGLHGQELEGLNPLESPRPFYEAMLEAMDTELGRLLAGIAPELPNTMILFLGDNGTPSEVTAVPELVGRAKNTLYEGGVNVPLIVSGPLVAQPGSECDAQVTTSDLFATVAALAGVQAAATLPGVRLDSTSLVPYLADPTRPSLRTFAYSESFEPLGPLGPSTVLAGRALRDGRFKMILRVAPAARPGSAPGTAARATLVGERHPTSSLALELYDLASDPYERVNLVPLGLGPAARAALRRMSAQLASLP